MKILLRILIYFLIIVFVIILIPYIICPVYIKQEPFPFAGSLFYNPYEHISNTGWLKANFHAHSRQWSGIMAGSSSSEDSVASRYSELKYDIAGISDYQSINTYSHNNPLYIPVYEHGYGLLKSHQLVIGAKKISWKEFMLFQSFHNKQDVINSLSADGEVISINHPKLRGAFTADDLKYMKGYNLLEAASHSYFNAADLWDTALSAGNSVFILASDDNHDINDPEDFGYVYTMINTHERNPSAVLSSLREGRAFGVEMEPMKDSTPRRKIEQSNAIPVISSCAIVSDTLRIWFDKNFDTLKFIGQNGIIKMTTYNDRTASYVIKHDDTYIRTELNQADLSNIFLNPVFRYDGELRSIPPEIDVKATWIFRGILFVTGLLVTAVVIYSRRRSK